MTEEDRREIEQLNGAIKNWLAVRKYYRKNKQPEDTRFHEARQEAVKARATLQNKFNQTPSLDDDDV